MIILVEKHKIELIFEPHIITKEYAIQLNYKTIFNVKTLHTMRMKGFSELVGNTILRTSKLHILLKYSLNTQIKPFLILL